MACRDKLWSSTPFSSSRDNQVRWHAETNVVICSFRQRLNVYWLRLLKSPRFVNQRQVSPLTHRDQCGHLLILSKTECLSTKTVIVHPLLSRDNWVWWHVSYPNFVWGPLFVGMWPSFDHLKMFNTHRCGIRKVLRCFGKKPVKNTNMGVYLAKWGCV